MIKSVCIVEDEKDIRFILRQAIEEVLPNADIAEFEDGESALDIIKQRKFDLLLTDLCMPNMEGNDLLQKINTTYSENTPKNIFVISAHIVVDETDNVGNIHMFSKPIDMDQLQKTIKGLVKDV